MESSASKEDRITHLQEEYTVRVEELSAEMMANTDNFARLRELSAEMVRLSKEMQKKLDEILHD